MSATFHWEWNGDGTWSFRLNGGHKVGRFPHEFAARAAGRARLIKSLRLIQLTKGEKMDDLEVELQQIRKAIANLLFGPWPIGTTAAREYQEQLDDLYDREAELEATLNYPPDKERNRDYD